MSTTNLLKRLSKLYVSEIVRLHSIPVSIVSDRDLWFTTRLWQGLQIKMGMQLHLSTAFHPQSNRQTERLIQVLEDMLKSCVLEFSGGWEDYIHMCEFAYNNSYQT